MNRVIRFTDTTINGRLKCYCGSKHWEDLRCVECGIDVLEESDLTYVANLLVEEKEAEVA